jgi:5-methylcytosine-specific restriction endonuclease McrA
MKNCLNCGKEIIKKVSKSNYAKRKYCSYFCKSNSVEAKENLRRFNLGRKLSPETIEKIRIKKLGSHPNISQEVREKRRQNFSGSNNPRWNGGSWNQIKCVILKRDNYTCQVCKLREPEIMEVDHILPKSVAPDLWISEENLITLCPNDHRRKTNADRKRYRMKKEKAWRNTLVLKVKKT